MPSPHLVYFADPMCSWCWGFSPVVQAITTRYGAALPIRLVLGGLRPWTREPMDERARAAMRGHWEHVYEASGQPFDFRFFERERFVYDTEPASRAVVVLRSRGMRVALQGLQRIQHAFYAQGRDVTARDTLSSLAVELGFQAGEFEQAFDSVDARDATRADFALAQSAGVRGFPTLIAGEGDDGGYRLITHGYQSPQRVLAGIESWIEATGQAAPTGSGSSCAVG